MEYEDFYHIIFKRKSIRKYKFDPLNEQTLEDISNYMDTVKPMYENITIEMNIVTQESVGGLLPVKAPYYILVLSEKKEGYLTNAGFMLQQIDLFLSHKGLGGCWAGMAQPKKEIAKESELEYVIALAFGTPAEPLHRKSISEFKRKNMEEIRDGSKVDELLEAARLAPSATNSQPWFFKIENDRIHAYCTKPNFIKSILYKKMNQIDMGIAICHLWIAAKHFGNELKPIINQEGANNVPIGYYYIVSLSINK